MAFYQNHVEQLCKDSGIPLTRHGCPIVGPNLAAKVLELNARVAAADAGIPASLQDTSGFTQGIIRAMLATALNELVNHAPKASKFAAKFATEVFQAIPDSDQVDSYDVPIPIRVAQQDALRSVHKTLTAALMFKLEGPGTSSDSEGKAGEVSRMFSTCFL
jgi:hypothetical protein